ncbi:hypothetical protein PCNPT3_03630 [Psychromonas sp. CNPT3]|uniref:zinc ribbon domain-containing protein n=1 Tax=Psychromonas sp. CNPT3 TaxID=314282 RepID=UPI00006E42BF|nr:zinc ribbon domain-containing protein [Psychromonas sp. CNPT3]AGH80668.1 hypothetical protein PCNPT3_03630 [Psychromonas sp. CNPT3]
MQLDCPRCKQPVIRTGPLERQCQYCQVNFKLQIDCQDCGDELERLQACGAVNFWCHKCNELKSKKTAIYHLLEV